MKGKLFTIEFILIFASAILTLSQHGFGGDDLDQQVQKILKQVGDGSNPSISPAPTKNPRRTPAGVPHLKKEEGPKETLDADKSHYNLFNPTPRDQMRELDADRPDFTDSPHTVDAGHIQFESGLFDYVRHKTVEVDPISGASTTTEEKTYSLNSFFLLVGLTNSLEMQAGFTSFVHQRTSTSSSDGSSSDSSSGVGDTAIRFKWNILGNDGGNIIIGVIPSVKLPTNSGGIGNKRLEEGVNLPMTISLPADWSLGLMPEWDRKKNDGSDSFHNEFISSYVLGHNVIGPIDGFGEFQSISSDEPGSNWAALSGFGFTLKAASNLQFDAEIRLGLNQAANDFEFSTGIVFRY